MQIDIKIMKLNKWNIPKNFDFYDLGNDPVILGYFDALQVKEVDINVHSVKLHPFTEGYNKLEEWKGEEKNNIVDLSSQEQILFIDICEESQADGTAFTENEVRGFWNGGSSECPYIFLSMIHINCSGNLKKALGKIKKVFEKNYLSYISFDYCDIVLVARNMQIQKFMEKIKKLFEIDNEEKTVFFDSFSMVCFQPSYARDELWKQQPKNTVSGSTEVEKPFHATINLSIRDHKEFNTWYEEVSKTIGGKLRHYNLFGRHDVSITNDQADTKWLMQVMTALHKKDNQKIFWTFETYIKIEDDCQINLSSDTAPNLYMVYDIVRKSLQDEIVKLKAVIDKSKICDKDRFIMPVYEVRDCICSIVKNGFAEEFICCIYESFLHFVSYMKAEIEKIDEDSKMPDLQEWKIAKGYDKYFAALNTLVNSTMHTEKQFVQTTGFNAVFYSVPPKIMAFYNAYIYRIKQLLKDNDCSEQYSFLIYPSFSSTISVERISLDEIPPCDRILTVTINEKSLYDIESVMYQMVHELGHYVGNELRCRNVRYEKIKETLLRFLISNCGIEKEAYPPLRQYIDANLAYFEKENTGQETNCVSQLYKYEYLEYISDVGQQLLQLMEDIENMRKHMDIFAEYYMKKAGEKDDFEDELLTKCGVEKKQQKAYVKNYVEQYSTTKCFDFTMKIQKYYEHTEDLERYIELAKSVYSECYADLQMILILAMNAEDYLNTFLINQNIPLEKMLYYYKDMIRISTVFRVMIDCNIWSMPGENDNKGYRTIYKFIDKYNVSIRTNTEKSRQAESVKKVKKIHQKVKKFDFTGGIELREKLSDEYAESIDVENLKSKMRYSVDISLGLYEYLLEVLEKSLTEYSEESKLEEILQTRKLIKTVLEFRDTTEVFSCIENELEYYKCNGLNLKEDKV